MYSPTEKMANLGPVICELILWENKYYPDTYTKPDELLSELKTNKEDTIKKYTTKVKKRIII